MMKNNLMPMSSMFFFFVIMTSTANAAVFPKDTWSCRTEEQIEAVTNALATNDVDLWATYLAEGDCSVVEGKRFSVLKAGKLWTKVKVYWETFNEDQFVSTANVKAAR